MTTLVGLLSSENAKGLIAVIVCSSNTSGTVTPPAARSCIRGDVNVPVVDRDGVILSPHSDGQQDKEKQRKNLYATA